MGRVPGESAAAWPGRHVASTGVLRDTACHSDSWSLCSKSAFRTERESGRAALGALLRGPRAPGTGQGLGDSGGGQQETLFWDESGHGPYTFHMDSKWI